MLETIPFFGTRGFFKDLVVADYLRVEVRLGVISNWEVFSPRALFIDCTEVSSSFSNDFLPRKEMGFLTRNFFFSTIDSLSGSGLN